MPRSVKVVRLHPGSSTGWKHRRQLIKGSAATVAGVALLASGQATAADDQTAAPASAAATEAPLAAAGPHKDDDGVELLDAVVVKARNRAEKLQDIPVAVSVVSGKDLEREGGKTFADAAARAAGIIVNEQNARQSSVSIRGLGKQGQTDAMETSVGVIVDNVFYSYSAMSWQNLVDTDQVEILRGPQGTLLGKNTNLGVLIVSTKAPSFTPQSTYEASYGKNGSYLGKASSTGPIVDGLLAYRASFYTEKTIGDTDNAFTPNQHWLDRDRLAGRLQFLLTPTPDLSARLIVDLQPRRGELDNGGDLFNAQDPLTYANGATRVSNTKVRFTERLARDWFSNRIPGYSAASQLGKDFVWSDAQQPVINGQDGISAQVDWNVAGHTVTSITAYRGVYFDARNDNDGTPFSINYNWNTDTNFKQYSQELRLSSLGKSSLDYQAGLYFLRNENDVNTKQQLGPDAGAWYATNAQYTSLNADAAGRSLLSDSLASARWTRKQQPETASAAVFGQINWHFTERATLTLGARATQEKRDNSIANVLQNPGPGTRIATGNNPAGDAAAAFYYGAGMTWNALTTAQRAQLTNALAIRDGQLKNFYATRPGKSIDATAPSFLFSPSWKVTDNTLLYASASYGEKSGLVFFNTSDGTPQNAKPEKARDYELGVKNSLFHRTLVFNANIYQTDIEDYQQQLQVADANQPSGWRGVTGNVPKVQLRGLEFDAAYAGVKYLTLRTSGAVAEAKYKDFKTAGLPAELSNQCVKGEPATCVIDFSGRDLPGASRYTLNAGAELRFPIANDHVFHASFNSAYRSGTNLATDLSSYGKIGGYTVTDAAIGIGKQNGQWDLSLVVKNLLDTEYNVGQGSFAKDGTSPGSYTPGAPRFYWLTLRGKF